MLSPPLRKEGQIEKFRAKLSSPLLEKRDKRRQREIWGNALPSSQN